MQPGPLVAVVALLLAGCLGGPERPTQDSASSPSPEATLATTAPDPPPLGEPTGNATGLGSSHDCVLLDDGRVRCWGDNEQGQLGARPT